MNAEAILGTIDDLRFSGRRRHHVDIGWGDAGKHRQIAISDTGIEVRITLPRGAFLADGAVIADDGTDVVVVRRPLEPAITVRFGDNTGITGARQLMLLGYVLGNQHAPIDVGDFALAAPLFTSAEAARALLAELGIAGDVTAVAMAATGWSRTSGGHHADHRH